MKSLCLIHLQTNKESAFISFSLCFVLFLVIVIRDVIIKSKYLFIVMENQSSVYLSNSSFSITTLPQPKIIIINPVDTTNCQDSSEISSVHYQPKQPNQHSIQHLRHIHNDWNHKTSKQWIEEQEEDDESMRKLYKQLKRQEKQKEQHQNQVEFLYVSSRGQEPLKPSYEYQQQQQIQSDEDQSNQPHLVISKHSNEMLYRPIVKNLMLQCIVKVVPPSLFAMQKQIELYCMRQKRLLLKAKKNKLPTSTHFAVLDTLNHKIAVFESNLSRTEYKYCKHTQQQQSKPLKQKQTQTTFASSLIKLNPITVQISSLESSQKCYLVFRSNLFGMKQQRMKVVKSKGKVYKSSRFSDIKDSYQNFQYDRLQIFQSKLAQKNTKGQLILDFKTKNMVQSSKNMMIENQNGDTCLSFYKRKDNIYFLAVIHPFNILQAFFIAISNLDHSFF